MWLVVFQGCPVFLRFPLAALLHFWVAPLLKLSYPHQVNLGESREAPFGHLGVRVPPPTLSPYPKLLLAQSSFDNPEWFYRHVEAHSLCCEYQAVGKDNHVVLCGWKGRATL